MTSPSDISILTCKPRKSAQSVASVRDWLHVNSCRNFADVMCLSLNRTRIIHAHYEVSSIFPSFLYRPILLSTVYHSHMDTLLLRCMNNGQSILPALLELLFVLSDNNNSARHFCTNKQVLSLYYLSSKFILFIFNKSLRKNFCNTYFVLRASF